METLEDVKRRKTQGEKKESDKEVDGGDYLQDPCPTSLPPSPETQIVREEGAAEA